jgi:hypothetical protein
MKMSIYSILCPEKSTGSTAKKSYVTSSCKSSKLAWSGIGDKPPAAPESTELESGGQWAVTTSASKLKTECDCSL